MPGLKRNDGGFGLVEAVIAIMILALIAVALAPALIGGLTNSAEQSTVATATRQLNSIIERARLAPGCAQLLAFHGAIGDLPTDANFSVKGIVSPVLPSPSPSSNPSPSPSPAPTPSSPHCGEVPANGRLIPGNAARLELYALEGGRVIAQLDAIIRIPEDG